MDAADLNLLYYDDPEVAHDLCEQRGWTLVDRLARESMYGRAWYERTWMRDLSRFAQHPRGRSGYQFRSTARSPPRQLSYVTYSTLKSAA